MPTAPATERHARTAEHPRRSCPGSRAAHPEGPRGGCQRWAGSVAPQPPLPAVFDVFVDEAGDQHGDQGVVPGADEHQRQAETHAQEGQGPAESPVPPARPGPTWCRAPRLGGAQGCRDAPSRVLPPLPSRPSSPVVVAEAWPPVGCPQQRLHRARQVDEHVAHEEEPAGEHAGLSRVRRCRPGTQPGPATPPGPSVGPANGQRSRGRGATSPQRRPRRVPGLPVGLPSSQAGARVARPCEGRRDPWRGRDPHTAPARPRRGVWVDRAGCLHGEDGSHLVQRGDQDPNLADAGREQQGPRRLPVGFAMAEDLWGEGASGPCDAGTAQLCARVLRTAQPRAPRPPSPARDQRPVHRGCASPEGAVLALAGPAPTPLPADPRALPAARAAPTSQGPPARDEPRLSLAAARCRAARPAAAGKPRGSRRGAGDGARVRMR